MRLITLLKCFCSNACWYLVILNYVSFKRLFSTETFEETKSTPHRKKYAYFQRQLALKKQTHFTCHWVPCGSGWNDCRSRQVGLRVINQMFIPLRCLLAINFSGFHFVNQMFSVYDWERKHKTALFSALLRIIKFALTDIILMCLWPLFVPICICFYVK